MAAAVSSPLYLGLDLSTQSCKAVVVDSAFSIINQSRVQFSVDLPHYNTEDGVHRAPGGHVTSPPLMWVEALELALSRLKEQGCPMERIAAVSGSGQQHGSVYWNRGARQLLSDLAAEKGPLKHQLQQAFVSEKSPIWMDTSTTESCRAMEALVGGPLELSRRTGSAGYERFTAHHIRALAKGSPEIYANCARVSLVSSWGASMFLGAFAAIDASDGAGMNLMDVRTRSWDAELLEQFLAEGDATAAAELRQRLGDPEDSWRIAGKIHPFWCQRFGLPPSADVVNWSGDNPCAAVGLGLSRARDIAISLGTSDTCYVVLNGLPPKPLPFGHLFPHPLPPHGNFFTMLCYTNGDLTRKKVRDDFANGDWDTFSAHVGATPVGNSGQLGIFLCTDEITPPLSQGSTVYGSTGDTVSSKAEPSLKAACFLTDSLNEPFQNCRAIIEGRALSMRLHLTQLNPEFFSDIGDGREPRLLLTGGASANRAIQQIFADVFGRSVVTADMPDSAAVGAAMRACHGAMGASSLPEAHIGGEVVSPQRQHMETYARLLASYEELERQTIQSRGR